MIRATAQLLLLSVALILAITSLACRPNRPSQSSETRAHSATPTLDDLWTGRAYWLLDAAHVGGEFQFHFLSIVRDDRELIAFYIKAMPRMAIGRARSSDGLNWIDEGGVLNTGVTSPPAWDCRMASFPGAWKDGQNWWLVYEGTSDDFTRWPGDIGLATSSDGGKTFAKHSTNPILVHERDNWERVNIGTPSLYRENGVWYCFYHGYDGKVCQIGVASGTDLAALKRSATNPIVPASTTDGAWDCGTTGKRSRIVKEDGYYYFAYEGSTAQPYERARWSTGLARSRSLTSGWAKCPLNPLIPQTPGHFGNDGPELLRLGDTWFLYVRNGEPGGGTDRYRLAPR